MGIISINSNIASLRVQNLVSKSSFELSRSFERLSSGMRINRGSDDAAGLAVALGLGLNSRVFNQAIRNANDAISHLNIADGALGELSNVLMRLKELAQQSANGSLSVSQRMSLDTEAYGLTEEFNRIINSTQFNGRVVLNGANSRLNVQLGLGSNFLELSINGELEHAIGRGTFSSAEGQLTTDARGQVVADFNGDGKLDVAVSDNTNGRVLVYSGAGDGTIDPLDNINIGGTPTRLTAGDLNGDGDIDLVVANGSDVKVLSNNGSGSFSVVQTLASNSRDVAVGDLNSDGIKDLVITRNTGIAVTLGTGTGTFQTSATNYAFALAGSQAQSVKLADLNGDNKLDIIAGTSGVGGGTNIYIGSGTGAFQTAVGYAGSTVSIGVGDINHDGKMDLIEGTGSGTVQIRIGNGDGTLSNGNSYDVTGGGDTHVAVSDVNGDGILDFASASAGGLDVMVGSGDGSFALSYTGTVSVAQAYGVDLADMNNDGVVDLISTIPTTIGLLNARTRDVTTIGRLDLTTQSAALASLETIDAILTRVTNERGVIGTAQSRLSSALNTLGGLADGYESARSRIIDSDTAEESAKAVRNQILQQAGSAALAQANIIPGIALSLLQSI